MSFENIQVPENWASYLVENTVKKNAFYLSGVMVNNQQLQTRVNAGGTTVTVPFWRDLTDTEANTSNDDLSDVAVSELLSSSKHVARISRLNKSWAMADLSAEVAGDNGLEAIKPRITKYWERQLGKRAIATCKGIMNDSIANHSSDLVLDKSAETGFTASFITSAAFKLGENFDSISAVALHSAKFEQMQTELENTSNPIEFVTVQGTDLSIPTWRGMALIVDDSLTPNVDVYPVFLFGRGLLGGAVGQPLNALESERLPSVGNGGGGEALWSRITSIVHPMGFKWTDTAVVGESPTLAELADPTNWTRTAAERGMIPFCAILTK